MIFSTYGIIRGSPGLGDGGWGVARWEQHQGDKIQIVFVSCFLQEKKRPIGLVSSKIQPPIHFCYNFKLGPPLGRTKPVNKSPPDAFAFLLESDKKNKFGRKLKLQKHKAASFADRIPFEMNRARHPAEHWALSEPLQHGGIYSEAGTEELPAITEALRSQFPGGRPPSADLAPQASKDLLPLVLRLGVGAWESLKAAECSFPRADSFHEAQGIASDIGRSHTMSHGEIWERSTLSPSSCQVTMPSDRLKAKRLKKKKRLQDRGTNAKLPGGNDYAA